MMEARGPLFPSTIKTAADVAKLRVPDPEEGLGYVLEAIRITKKALNGRVPLIGFAGAPWTILAYMVEGHGSKTFSKARGMLYREPALAHQLLAKITATTIAYLEAQVAAGAQAVQVFDSWAGILPPAHYREFSTRYIAEIREPATSRFDIGGMALSAVALCSLMAGLEFASRGIGSLPLVGGLLVLGTAAAALYLRHARVTAQPVLDFRLMRFDTFRISVWSGSLTRIAVGAVPFLLPMMLQLGFGFSAVQSGLITFASAAGSLLMRITTPAFLRVLGFRRVMVWIGLLALALLALIAAFRPGWPLPVIYAALLVGGFFQSLQFMAYNTIAYAEMPRAEMSAATSFYTTFQQLSLTLGIAVSAAALAASAAWRGHEQPLLVDFSSAFLVVAGVGLLAPLLNLRLAPDAGAEISGHHPKPKPR